MEFRQKDGAESTLLRPNHTRGLSAGWDGWDAPGTLVGRMKIQNRQYLQALGRWDGCTPPSIPPPLRSARQRPLRSRRCHVVTVGHGCCHGFDLIETPSLLICHDVTVVYPGTPPPPPPTQDCRLWTLHPRSPLQRP